MKKRVQKKLSKRAAKDSIAKVYSKRNDAAVKRFDRLGIIHTDIKRKDEGFFAEPTPEKFLKIKGRLTRTGVLQYQDIEGNEWNEYRSPAEVFDPESMASFELVVLTDDHPPEMISADNVRRYQVGHVGNNIEREGDYLVATILVTDPPTIKAILNGKAELSCGYYVVAIDEPGISPEGEAYDKLQTEIRGNHLALVDEGRAGPECCLQLDAQSAISEVNMKRNKNKSNKDALMVWGDQEFEVPDGFAEHFKSLQATEAPAEAPMEPAADQEPAPEDMEMEEESLDMEEEGMEKEEPAPSVDEEGLDPEKAEDEEEEKKAMDSLLSKSPKGSKPNFDHRAVGEYLALLDSARTILGTKVNTDHSPSFLKRACIYKVCPSLKGNFDRASADKIDGAYSVAKALHSKKVGSRKSLNDHMFRSVDNAKRPRAVAALDSLDKRSNRKGNK